MQGEALLGGSHIYDPQRGEFVNAKHKRISEILSDYNPYLVLGYIPPADRIEADTHPFALFFCPPDREPQLISIFKEEEVDERLLAWVFMNDSSRNDPLAYLEKLEDAQRIMHMKEQMEKEEEKRDRAAFMLKSPLHTIKMGKGKVVHT